ncbi:hypothetical protein RJ639_015093 [Escallonia herrerae]|uniref:DNA-directed RNA polymerase III subunit RPC3 n=1 Tax=Escallonia herrerae TaxID=1293975 RepID=A0AA88VHR5_9ASTE|nr:hypothetical protein RJ639_015093 [Escallonia herrerae]
MPAFPPSQNFIPPVGLLFPSSLNRSKPESTTITAVMVSQHGIKLAVHLISSYFGDVVSKVCECLLRRGTLTLAQIVRFTELRKQNVVNSLLVLGQHNCVQAFAIQQEGGFGEAPKIITQYIVLFDNIIHHMRFPKFVTIVSEELSKECEEIFEGLLQHGRLSVNQLVDRHKQTSNQSGGLYTTLDALQDSFNRLVNARYVERCPAHEPFLAPPGDDETPAKKRGAKSAKVFDVSSQMAEALETIEQRALAAASPMASMRFFIDADTWTDVPGKNSGENPTSATVGEKRKQDSLELNGDAWATNKKKEVLWRVNFEEFVRRLRHKPPKHLFLIRYQRNKHSLGPDTGTQPSRNVRTRLDNGAGIVLSAILEATRSEETKVKMENSDLKNIIGMAQNQEVESIVLKKYGREAYRMFRLLSKAGRLVETDQISNTTFVEKKDAVKILYQLWNDDYLQMEDLLTSWTPRNMRVEIFWLEGLRNVVTHGARQSQFLLWKVNKSTLWVQVLDDMFHAALNLKLRIAYEQEQEKEIMQIPREKLVGDLEKRYKRFRKRRIVLESSLMKLDDALMLFHDF